MNEENQIAAVQALLEALNNLGVEMNRLRGDMVRNSSYLARQEIESIKNRIKQSSTRLEHYGFKVYSQQDEDGILEEIFRRLEIKQGIFCEIGVEHGLECNSLYLLHKGWRGAWLEGNPNQREKIERIFHSLLTAKRLSVGIGFITPENIDDAIEKTLSTIELDAHALDFLSIDIDGMDIYLLESLTYRPKVICIEYNAKFPPTVSKKPVFDPEYCWQGGDYMGSSLSALTAAANSKGYTLVGTNITGVNAFFVREELIKGRFDGPFTPENLYNPPRYHLFFDYFHSNIGHRADFGPYIDLQ